MKILFLLASCISFTSISAIYANDREADLPSPSSLASAYSPSNTSPARSASSTSDSGESLSSQPQEFPMQASFVGTEFPEDNTQAALPCVDADLIRAMEDYLAETAEKNALDMERNLIPDESVFPPRGQETGGFFESMFSPVPNPLNTPQRNVVLGELKNPLAPKYTNRSRNKLRKRGQESFRRIMCTAHGAAPLPITTQEKRERLTAGQSILVNMRSLASQHPEWAALVTLHESSLILWQQDLEKQKKEEQALWEKMIDQQ